MPEYTFDQRSFPELFTIKKQETHGKPEGRTVATLGILIITIFDNVKSCALQALIWLEKNLDFAQYNTICYVVTILN